MISEAGHIPDLAGAGNLIITTSGGIRLVDINNISGVSLDPSIHLDEKGYPVCDKSIEALSLIEEKILGRQVDMEADIYKWFLDPERQKALKAKEALLEESGRRLKIRLFGKERSGNRYFSTDAGQD